MAARTQVVPALSAEFADVDLGDDRLNRRLGLLADQVAERPGESFPKALNDSDLEAAYRFFGNELVTPEAILAPHFRQTVRRGEAESRVLVVHDTTQFEFGGQTKREGLGRLIRPGQGFFDRFKPEKAERLSSAVGGRRQRKMAEESLPRTNEPAQPLAFCLAAELELGRVVHYQDP